MYVKHVVESERRNDGVGGGRGPQYLASLPAAECMTYMFAGNMSVNRCTAIYTDYQHINCRGWLQDLTSRY